MRKVCALVALWGAASLAPPLLFGEANPALAAYKAANFNPALPLLQRAAADAPDDAAIAAALLSTLLHCDLIDDAAALEKRLATAFPNSAETIAARGEFAFYLGDMLKAEQLLRSAGELNGNLARAYFGLSKLYWAASFYRRSRLFCLKAHELDPDDALITRSWLRYVPAEKRKELFPSFRDAHPWLYRHSKEDEETVLRINEAVGERKVYETEGGPKEATLKIFPLLVNPQHARGVGLEFRVGNGKPLHLLFDTGASGILLKQSAVDKAGLKHLGSGVSWGVGDGGTRGTFSALSDTCQVGTLKFKTCVFKALDGNRAIPGDEDGLLGADLFEDYVVRMDFQNHLLHLTPLPPRPHTPDGYDRMIPADEKNFTPVFRFGHMLCITTKVNNKADGLFLLDTGAEMSNMDATFARSVAKLSGENSMVVKGLSGAVKNVYEANKADLQFGRFRQNNIGVLAFNLNSAPEHQDFRLSGILGIDVLSLFDLTIDYRNGLVNFDYKSGNKSLK